MRCEVTLTIGKWQSCQMDLVFDTLSTTSSLAHYWLITGHLFWCINAVRILFFKKRNTDCCTEPAVKTAELYL